MQKARRHPTKGLRPLVSVWFQGLFTPLFRVLFTFPSRYSFTIGLSGVFSLTRWCWQIQPEFHLLRHTQDPRPSVILTNTGLSPPTVTFSTVFSFKLLQLRRSYYPTTAATIVVWAVPLSLATTRGITVVFSSSGYLDVSVPRVRPPTSRGTRPSTWWVAPFGYLRITAPVQLPVAFRSLARPSSPLRA